MENVEMEMTLQSEQPDREVKIPKPDTFSLYTNMKEALGQEDYQGVCDLYEKALEIDHPKGLPQYCLGYYMIALYTLDRADKVVEMEEYRMEYDKFTQEDIDTYYTCAKANIVEKKFDQALLDLEKAYEHSYFMNGKDAEMSVNIQKMQLFTSLCLLQTKKSLIMAAALDPEYAPLNYVYHVAYSRWNDAEKAREYKLKWEASGMSYKTVIAELFEDEKVCKTLVDGVKV